MRRYTLDGDQHADGRTGCLDPQVWMSAFAYMGIIVPLYSFSLFL